jgi:hypothetical protein
MSVAQRGYDRLQQLVDQVDDRRQAQGVLSGSQVTGRLDHLYAMLNCQQSRVDELAVAAFAAHVVILDLLHCLGQFPANERGTIAQGTGLATRQGHIVPGFEIADIEREMAFVLGDDLIVRDYDDSIGIGAQRDMVPRVFRRHGS